MADDGERGSPRARAAVGGAAESAIIVTVTKERKLEIEGERAGKRPRDCHWQRGPLRCNGRESRRIVTYLLGYCS